MGFGESLVEVGGWCGRQENAFAPGPVWRWCESWNKELLFEPTKL